MKFKYFLASLVTSMIIISCASSKGIDTEKKNQDTYTSVFPNNEVSDEIEDIIGSIKRINNITFYKRYDFENKVITVKDLQKKDVFDKAYMLSNINKTSSGTCAIISVSGSNIALLTAAHIVSYPDTVIGYYIDNGVRTKFIESIAIKTKQQIYGDLPNGGALQVLAKDEDSDIAVVGNSLGGFTPINAHALRFKFGSAKELKWGSFIYIFGFPMGNKMVTRGIVSSPNKGSDNRFLVDAVINKGSSGGLVFAIRGESPNFELVGMVSTVPAIRNIVLTPYSPNLTKNFVPGSEYEGRVQIKRIVDIKYGIGKIISVESIKKFFKKHKTELLKRGFDLSFL